MKFFIVIGLLLLGLVGCQVVPDGTPAPVESTPVVLPSAAPTQPAATPQAASTTPTPTQPAAAGLGVKAEELRGLRIQFWYAANAELRKEYESQIEEFNRANVWGIGVAGRAFPASTNLEEALTGLSSAESLPQAVAAPMEMLLTWQAQNKVLVALDAYARDPEWGLTSQEISDFGPAFWQAQQWNGQLWGIPAAQNAQVLLYNQSWAEELGFRQPPATPADFLTQACAAAKANLKDGTSENDGTGGWVMATDPLALESWRQAFGSDPLPVEDGRQYQFNTPPSVKAFTYLRKLLDERCAWNARKPDPFPYFAQRQALFISGSLADLPYLQRTLDLNKSADRWAILPYPAEKGQPVILSTGASQAILKSSPAGQLAAWLFYRYLNLPRVQARLAAAGSQIPSRMSAVQEMEAYRREHAQWAQALGWKEQYRAAPRLASWRTVRRMLQDAAWQILQPFTKPDDFPAILAELDQLANGTQK